MNANKLFPSQYLKAAELDRPKVVTIAKLVPSEEVGSEGDVSPVLYFKDFDQRVTLNKTRTAALVSLFGEETDDWVGKEITLVKGKTRYQGKLVDCIDIAAAEDIPF